MAVTKQIVSNDGLRRLVISARREGRGSFAEHVWMTDENISTGEFYSLWQPALESGIYESPEAAEADARLAISWLQTE